MYHLLFRSNQFYLIEDGKFDDFLLYSMYVFVFMKGYQLLSATNIFFLFSLSLFICPFFFHTFSSATRMMQTSRKYLLIYTCVYDISKIQCMWCQNFCICFYLFINQDCIHRGFTNKQPLKPAWSPLLIF